MAILEIRDLHVSVDADGRPKEILQRRRPHRPRRRDPRDHGPERLRASRRWPTRSPGTRSTPSPRAGHPRRRGRPGDDGRRARPRRAVPGHAVPGRGPRRVGVQLPAHRGDRDPRRGAQAARPGSRTSATAMEELAIDPSFAERYVNEGFSGGEKKRHEILQLELLKPKVAVLDETDSGLDIDALQGRLRGRQPRPRAAGDVGVLLITHYTRILRYITAGLRARLRRRPDRRGGRPRARRRTSRPRATSSYAGGDDVTATTQS